MSRWDGQYSSAILSLAKELAKTNRVFYVDHPFTIKDFIKGRNSRQICSRRDALLHGKNFVNHPPDFPEKFFAITPRVVMPMNFLPAGFFYDFFSSLNDKIVLKAIQKTIQEFEIKNFLLLNSFDPFYGRNFKEELQPQLFIYQTRDDISQAKYAAKHGVYLENEMVKKADVVFATSSELTRLKSKINPHTYHLPNAADVELFKQANPQFFQKHPRELQNSKGKIILYMGNIGWARIDFPLLKKIADEFPRDTLLLVGPTDSEEHIKIGLDKMPNVIFTGAKKISELPEYVAHADCTLIPFQCNKLTKSIYPLKINEYLAAGKPVVTTAFSEDIFEFKDIAYIAQSHDEFLQMIKKSLEEDSPQLQNLRINVAEKNSWKGRVDLFWEIVEKHLSAKAAERI